MDLFIKILSYLATGAVPLGFWIWKTSAQGARKESNIHNALEALKLQIEHNKTYFDEKILRLERDLKEQKEEKRELENKIYVKIGSVEGLVTETNKEINHIKLIVTKIAAIKQIEINDV